ncbi:MAG: UDP-galactopyranose mutase [Clostridia bacterium]|nr:UDP-galactopyranose mutase [Clostridia bacterium]
MFDYIIVGSGFAGSVCARSLADAGKRVLVLERRPHIGGNAYDCTDENGILIHKYGPHIFHTNEKRVYEYLSRFTEWRKYDHEVLAKAGELEFPVPFNLNSLYKVFSAKKAEMLEKKLISAYGPQKKVPIGEMRESTDDDIRELAEFVYNNVFLHYTMKQWGQKPEEIDPATTARVPVFISRDNRYFQDEYQGMPLYGYTPMFERMLDHKNITVKCSVNADAYLKFEDKIIFENEIFEGKVIYTGALDELFGYCYGALPYRTLDFGFEHHDVTYYQSHGTVNYTVDEPYTRITEYKYLTGQEMEGSTTIMKEFSRSYRPETEDIPYYAIINDENNSLYQKYLSKAKEYENLLLLGRLAEYKYYNMDKIVSLALQLCDTLTEEK